MQMIKGGQKFKVVEFDNGLVILHPGDSLGQRNHVELVVGDMPTICEYIVRYQEHRADGLAIKDAHERALRDAHVLFPGVMDLPDVVKVKQ